MARILLGVTGGIAAYKALELTRLAIKAGHAVRVVQTPAVDALRRHGVVRRHHRRPGPDHRVGGRPAARRLPRRPRARRTRRSATSSWSSAPTCSPSRPRAPTRSPSSPHGHADNLLTAAALACRRPLILAPAMNAAMYEHPATQANLALLRERGAIVLEPGTGSLASLGEQGVGRLPEPPELLAAIERALGAQPRARRPEGARHRRRHARADRRRALRRQPLLAAGWASRSPRPPPPAAPTVTVIAANVSLPRRAGIDYVDVDHRRRAGGRRRARASRTPTCC